MSSQVIFNFSRCNGYLAGTCGWLKWQLQERQAALKITHTKQNSPAVFLEYKEGEGRKSSALAIFDYWRGGYGLQKTGRTIEQWPFPDDIQGAQFFGATLTPAATAEMKRLAEQAAELLQAEMDKDDRAGEELPLQL